MADTAYYNNDYQFTISGSNETDVYFSGVRVEANCGGDGYRYVTVNSGTLSGSDTIVTTISGESDALTSNLADVEPSVVIPGATGNIPHHAHSSNPGEGGTITVISDHGDLTGLSDDDHTQYSKVDGSRNFTGIVSYNEDKTFTQDAELVAKKYVDDNTVTDHGNLSGLADDDHTQYVLHTQNHSGNYNWAAGTGNMSFATNPAYNLCIGGNAGNSITDGDSNICIGYDAGTAITIYNYNVLVGHNAGKSHNSSQLTAIGYAAGEDITDGTASVIIGTNAGADASQPKYSILIGHGTGQNCGSGEFNTCIGFSAARMNTGSNNVCIGSEAGYTGDGSSNIFVGYRAGYNETGSNKLYIENSNSATPLIYGDFATDEIKINGRLEMDEDIELNPSPDSDHAWSGLTALMTVDENATGYGAALHMDTDGNWIEADASASGTMPCQAIACEAGTGSKVVLMQGFIRDDSWEWNVGNPIYVSETTGALTQFAPTTSGALIQIVGFATHADRMFFNSNYYTITHG